LVSTTRWYGAVDSVKFTALTRGQQREKYAGEPCRGTNATQPAVAVFQIAVIELPNCAPSDTGVAARADDMSRRIKRRG